MQETLIVLAVFVAFAVLFQRLRLGTVLGFLIGGAAVGPFGLGLVHELEAVRLLGELGVVFLLFNLGLELKLERFRLFGVRVYALACTQLLLTALVKGGLVVFLVVCVSRYVLPRVLEYIAQVSSDEVFTAITLLIVLGASFATEEAGLSTALGAFVAGLMVADSEYRHQIAADIAPFRGLLLGMFFLTVGMTINLELALADLDRVVAIAVGLMLLKALLLLGLARALGYAPRLALELGCLLAQGSEFAFVMFGLAVQSGLLVGPAVPWMTVAIALSMAVTALAAALGRPLLDRVEGEASASLADLDARTAELENHVVIAGFGQVGMALARHLVSLGIPVLVLDYDPKHVRTSQAHRLPVFFGNAARADVLRAAHVGSARLMVVALPSRTGAERVVRTARALYPNLRLLARVPDEASVPAMRAAGADAVVVEGLTTARDLAERAILLYETAADAATGS